jgi:hypothetical protein
LLFWIPFVVILAVAVVSRVVLLCYALKVELVSRW